MKRDAYPGEEQRQRLRDHMRSVYISRVFKAKVDKALERELSPGWAFPLLFEIDEVLWGRWPFWCEALIVRRPPTYAIPQITWEEQPNPTALKMLQRVLGALQDEGLSYYGAIEYLLDWLLCSFDTRTSPPLAWNVKASLCYQLVDIGLLLLYPYDYWGYLLSEIGHGKRTAFFPTPLGVVEMMSQMTFEEGDASKSVMDPCVGTGRFLLSASNHSLRLHGQDVDYLVLRACLVNGWLYAPWMVKPLPEDVWGEGDAPSTSL